MCSASRRTSGLLAPLRNRIRGREHGQVLVVFALAAMVIVGIISLAVDYGFLVDQHRNLQAFVDEAAIAGAEQLPISPTTSDQANAREWAFIYLRDNLGMNLSPVAGSSQHPTRATCGGSSMDVTKDIVNCNLQSPYDNYTITIETPATFLSTTLQSQAWTVGVTVSDTVANSFAQVIGFTRSTASASAVAYHNQAVHSPYAVYANTITTGNHLESIAGGVYVTTAIMTQSSGASALCVLPSYNEQGVPVQLSGTIGFAPGATQPAQLVSGASASTCTSGAAGQVIATGDIYTSPVAAPTFALPPSSPAAGAPNPPPAACLANAGTTNECPAATASNLCVNGESGNCYSPGSYSTIGWGSSSNTGPIANNLNPGLYYISGNGTCPGGPTSNNCDGVLFGGNTLNANYADVTDRCWTSPNNPPLDQFTPPCPDGFAFDPSTPTDPMCAASPQLSTPTFAVVGKLSGGALDPTGAPLGTLYYVRVTATDKYGETTSNEVPVVVDSKGAKKGSITGTITPVAGATSYKVYGPSTVANQEVLDQTLSASTTSFTLTTAFQANPGYFPTVNTTGNAPLPNPSFSLAASATGATAPNGLGSVTGTTYYVRVTALNSLGETLSSENSVKVTSIAGLGTITVTINTVLGATGYEIYGPSTASNSEISYNSGTSPVTLTTPTPALDPTQTPPATLTFSLDHVPTFSPGVPYPTAVNSTGCAAAGFHNLPTGPGLNYGVTFILYNDASVCLNNPCSSSGSGKPVVLLSPFCSALPYPSYSPPTSAPYSSQTATSCPNYTGSGSSAVQTYPPSSGPYQNDGAFVIYSTATAQGWIEASGSGTELGIAGSIFAPGMTINIKSNAQIEVTPGQVFVSALNIQSGNQLNPAIYWDGNRGGNLPAVVKLVQ